MTLSPEHESFRRTVYVSHPNRLFFDLIDEENPDVVIYETVERRLGRVEELGERGEERRVRRAQFHLHRALVRRAHRGVLRRDRERAVRPAPSTTRRRRFG